MATRTYLFTPEETAQFNRLVELGFERRDHFKDTDDPQILFLQVQEGVAMTFFPELYVDDAGEEDCWGIEVHGKSIGGFAYTTTDAWLTMTEFTVLINPGTWSDMLSTLKSLQCLADWNQIMQPQLDAALQTQPDPVSLSLDVG